MKNGLAQSIPESPEKVHPECTEFEKIFETFFCDPLFHPVTHRLQAMIGFDHLNTQAYRRIAKMKFRSYHYRKLSIQP